MPDYTKGKIYKIYSPTKNLMYIGSTTRNLPQRMAEHVSHFKRYKNGKGNLFFTAFKILECEDYKIELIENYPCNNSQQLTKKEGEHIKILDCINKRIEGRTPQEYREANKEEIKQREKQYREANKEEKKQRDKQYYEEHKEEIKQRDKQYREANKEEIQERKKQYYEANKEEIKQRKKQYREANKEQRKEYREANKEVIKEKDKQRRKQKKEQKKEQTTETTI